VILQKFDELICEND